MDNDITPEIEILQTLQELLRITKLTSYREVRNSLLSILDTTVARGIYNLSDGSRGTDDIAKEVRRITGVGSPGTVSNYWAKWRKLGIVEPDTRIGRRMVKVFDLADYDIDLTVNE